MPSATDLLHIPFDAGTHEEADRKLLPQGLLRRAENVRLRRSGSLGVRYGYAAQPNVDDEGNPLTVFDVASHDGVLLAFASSFSGSGGPGRVHTLTGGAWRAEGHEDGRTRSFAVLSELREVYRPTVVAPDLPVCSVAYAAGYVAFTFQGPLITLGTPENMHVAVFDPDTGAEILFETVAGGFIPKVVAVGDAFVFVWRDDNEDLRACTFDPATDTALSSDVLVAAGSVNSIALAPVSGTTDEFLIAYRDNTTGRLLRLDDSLSTLASGTVTTTLAFASLSLVESGGSAHLLYSITGPVRVVLETFSTSTLASTIGPTTLATTTLSTVRVALGQRGTELVASYTDRIDTPDEALAVITRLVDPPTHSASAAVTRAGVELISSVFTSPDGFFTGALVSSVTAPGALTSEQRLKVFGVADLLEQQGLECALARGFGRESVTGQGVATDGARFWTVVVQREEQGDYPSVVEFRVNTPQRRQVASLGGLLYVAGGHLAVWDGQRLVESGFLERPVIHAIANGSVGGGLTPNALYSYVAVYEYLDAHGNRHLSDPSDPVTHSGAATSKDLTISSPLSPRGIVDGGNAVLLVFRTLAAPDRTHRLAETVIVENPPGELVTVTDSMSDSDLRDEQVVYTQGTRGSTSGPLAHEPPEPCEYVWATRDRLLLGGLPSASQWQQSKRLFPAEPMQFSSALAFFGSIRGDVTAVASQDGLDYVFSRNEIFVIEGAGPDDNGNGEFASPRKLPGDDVGCIDWRSVVASAAGIWFQASPDRLYLLPRGGGAPAWAGQPVRETLEAFPVVTAAAVVANDNVVCWAVQNAGGSAGRLVCHDTRSGEWYVDTLSDLGGPITAMCEHESRLAVVVGGRVYLQDTAFPASTFLEYGVTTGSIAPFGVDAHGRMVSVTMAAEYRGDCQVQASVSYDDEGSFTAIGTPFAVSGFTAGDTVELQWWPLRRKGSRYTLRFNVTAPSGGAATEGVLFNHLTLEVQRARRPRRTTSAERR